MSGDDSRFLLQRDGESQVRERGSRFLGFAFRASSPEEARAAVLRFEKRFHDATHVCFAWKIGAVTRAADSGEPAGTAGKPILAAIDTAQIDEACVAVVRYFGGTKLGTAGLSRCYREAARLAIEAAGKVEVFDTERFGLSVPYEKIDSAKRLLLALDVTLERESFAEQAEFVCRVRKSRVAEFRRRLAEERIGTASPFPSSLRSPTG